MVNQESLMRQTIEKANEQLKKQRKENREKEMTRVLFQSLTGGGEQTSPSRTNRTANGYNNILLNGEVGFQN
ncbi:unnamed protein product [Prunus armeniaca]|uniref:Uncharacterized protein n=1 Tax=Prunus armeniaca TaxID=36596 RepID=A0A6J5WW06_PRUAR|nr:unnamed protein product [Prunus armeniaca]CAB4302548.1 unnamed protein product [Prunus armeniaca]